MVLVGWVPMRVGNKIQANRDVAWPVCHGWGRHEHFTHDYGHARVPFSPDISLVPSVVEETSARLLNVPYHTFVSGLSQAHVVHGFQWNSWTCCGGDDTVKTGIVPHSCDVDPHDMHESRPSHARAIPHVCAGLTSPIQTWTHHGPTHPRTLDHTHSKLFDRGARRDPPTR